MLAVVVDPEATGLFALKSVEPPQSDRAEAIVRVHAFSLNRGEVRRARSAKAGWRPGWDLAGVVEQAALDGSGPAVGTRVVGFMPAGAWAERVAVPTRALAPLPESVSFAAASTLPVAGMTALLALERGGLLLGRRVLITGATGGVGTFACQMAAAAGALVTAQVRRPEQADYAKAAGAHQVVFGELLNGADQYGPFDLVLDSVGGSVLPAALGLLAKDGQCVLFGTTSGNEIALNAQRFYGLGGASLYGFILFHELERQPASRVLARLVDLLAAGTLRPQIDLEASWKEVAPIASQLMDRTFYGKAVLQVVS